MCTTRAPALPLPRSRARALAPMQRSDCRNGNTAPRAATADLQQGQPGLNLGTNTESLGRIKSSLKKKTNSICSLCREAGQPEEKVGHKVVPLHEGERRGEQGTRDLCRSASRAVPPAKSELKCSHDLRSQGTLAVWLGGWQPSGCPHGLHPDGDLQE